MCNGTVPGAVPGILFRLEDGGQTFYHATGIVAQPGEASRNQALRSELNRHCLAMCKAYTLMQLRQMDMNGRIFESEVSRMLTGRFTEGCPGTDEPIYDRLVRYIEEARRDGVIGPRRYAVVIGKARKLQRFLIIKGLSGISARDFSTDLLLAFRHFIYDEFRYVPAFPDLYPRGSGHRPPKKRCRDTTVVHDLNLLRAFFAELENAGEVHRSPFRRLSGEKLRSIMHVMYDDPVFLRADELRRLIRTPVPQELQRTKDIFVLNCALGCRIGDLQHLSMDKVARSADGIPYVHYIPAKTARAQKTNREIQTPLVRCAMEVIDRTQLAIFHGCPSYELQRYNKQLRRLLEFCGIDRLVSCYDPDLGDNRYRPLWAVASSKLARKTHVDMLNKIQINYYAAGLHRAGSDAVFRYTSLELADRLALLQAAFGEVE